MLVDILRGYVANEVQCIKDREQPTKVYVLTIEKRYIPGDEK